MRVIDWASQPQEERGEFPFVFSPDWNGMAACDLLDDIENLKIEDDE